MSLETRMTSLAGLLSLSWATAFRILLSFRCNGSISRMCGDTVLDLVGWSICKNPVQFPDRLSGISSECTATAFKLVQLFQHSHRDNQVMLVEIPDGGGIMNQNVGIKYVIDRAGCHHASSD